MAKISIMVEAKLVNKKAHAVVMKDFLGVFGKG